MTITINSYRPLKDAKTIVGHVSFNLTNLGMFFNDCPVIRKRQGGYFVASPSRPYKNKEGEDKYAQFWGFTDRAQSEAFQSKLMPVLEKYWKEQGHTISQ